MKSQRYSAQAEPSDLVTLKLPWWKLYFSKVVALEPNTGTFYKNGVFRGGFIDWFLQNSTFQYFGQFSMRYL